MTTLEIGDVRYVRPVGEWSGVVVTETETFVVVEEVCSCGHETEADLTGHRTEWRMSDLCEHQQALYHAVPVGQCEDCGAWTYREYMIPTVYGYCEMQKRCSECAWRYDHELA
jgi:hypothetical protein